VKKNKKRSQKTTSKIKMMSDLVGQKGAKIVPLCGQKNVPPKGGKRGEKINAWQSHTDKNKKCLAALQQQKGAKKNCPTCRTKTSPPMAEQGAKNFE
jgi:hypothetical protein